MTTLALLAAACIAPPPRQRALPPAPAPETGTPGPAPTAPLPVDRALGGCDGDFVDPGPWPNQLREGRSLHRARLDDAVARCNDGSAPALLVRAATTPQTTDRWVLHLQGGSSCESWQSCRDRWCGQQEGGYDASKMSSDWVPETVLGTGIDALDPHNPFATWNHVWFYACTSDDWLGASSAITVSDPAGVGPPFTMHAEGYRVLEEGLAALERGLDSDDGAEVLPRLGDAEEVLFTGSSAGALGAQQALDAVAARFGRGVDVVGVLDAGFYPGLASLPPGAQSRLLDHARTIRAWDAAVGLTRVVDASCAAGPDPDACTVGSEVLYSSVSTPFFVRQDQRDPVLMKAFGEAFDGDLDAWSTEVRASLRALPPAVGVFSQACGAHVGLERDAWFWRAGLSTPTGGEWSFAAALDAWRAGGRGRWLDPGDGSRSGCPGDG